MAGQDARIDVEYRATGNLAGPLNDARQGLSKLGETYDQLKRKAEAAEAEANRSASATGKRAIRIGNETAARNYIQRGMSEAGGRTSGREMMARGMHEMGREYRVHQEVERMAQADADLRARKREILTANTIGGGPAPDLQRADRVDPTSMSMRQHYRAIEARQRQARLDAMQSQQSQDAARRSAAASAASQADADLRARRQNTYRDVRLRRSQEAFTETLRTRYAPDHRSREEYELRERMAARRERRALPWNAAAAEERLERIRAGRRGFNMDSMMRGAGRELSIQGSQFGLPYLGLGMGPAAAAIGTVGAVGYMAYQHKEEQVARREAIRQSVNDPIAAQRTMRLNFDFKNLAEVETEIEKMSKRHSVKVGDVNLAMAGALSAGGGASSKQVLAAVDAAMQLAPTDAQSGQAISTFIMDLTKVAAARGMDIDAKSAAGFLVQRQRAGHEVNLEDTARYSGSALSTLSQANPNDSIEYLMRLNAATTQMSVDSHGRFSRTGDVRLSEGVNEWKPEAGVLKSGVEISEQEATQFRGAKSLEERIGLLQQSPNLKAAFLETHDYEATVKGAIVAIVEGSKYFTDAMQAAKEQIGELNSDRAKDFDDKVAMLKSGPTTESEELNRFLAASLERQSLNSTEEQRTAVAREYMEKSGESAGYGSIRRWIGRQKFDQWTGEGANPNETAIAMMRGQIAGLEKSTTPDKAVKIAAIEERIEKLQKSEELRLERQKTQGVVSEVAPDPNAVEGMARHDLRKERSELSDELAERDDMDPMLRGMKSARVAAINEELARRDAPEPIADPAANQPAVPPGVSNVRGVWRNRMLKLPGITNTERAGLEAATKDWSDEKLAEEGGALIEEAQGKEGRNSDKNRQKTESGFKAWAAATGDKQVSVLEQIRDLIRDGQGGPVVVTRSERSAPGSNASLLSSTS